MTDSEPVRISAGNDQLREVLGRFATIPDDVRASMEAALAEELILLEEDLRGPTPGSPGIGQPPGRERPPGQNPLAPGLGLVPINTGRLLSSVEVIPSGTSAVMTMDAQDPRSGFFYASVAHHAGEPESDTQERVTARWNAMAEAAGTRMAAILDESLRGTA